MSAEILRRAATLMRERAEAADGGPWFAFTAKSPRGYVHGVTTDLDTDYDADLFVGSSQRNAVHIASWHPAVALAVADSLDQAAAILAESHDGPLATAMRAIAEPLVGVARIYLGEDA